MVDFVLLDESAGALTTSGQAMDPATLSGIAAACQIQLNRDFAAHYGGAFRVRAGDSAGIQPGENVFALLATLPNAPGAIAYHDVDGAGVPVLYDAITLSDSLVGPGNSVSVAISHELLETAADEGCNQWADAGGTEYAHEVCDAVESQTYGIGTVSVSNFVARAFWIPNHIGPYDFMTSIGMGGFAPPVGPLMTAPGGYQVVRSSGTGDHQVFGRRVETIHNGSLRPVRRPWRADSRRARRGVAE